MASRRGALPLLFAIAALLCMAVPAPANQHAAAQEAALKAAFIYRIASFVSWPAKALGSGESPFRVVVVGDRDLAAHVDEAFANQRVQGHPVRVASAASASEAGGAHLVFLSEHVGSANLVASTAGSPVLTMSDADGFVTRGGIIELVRDGARLRFEVNAANAERAGLKLSSQVLRLASQVHGTSSGG